MALQKLSAKMYNWRVASVLKKLAAQGKATGPLSLADLTALGHLDQYHYLGEATSYKIIDLLQLTANHHLCDIGSGVGGTARILAHQTGCTITAIEIQESLNQLARTLTQRVGLSQQIQYITADFLSYTPSQQFTHFIALLTFLHIPNRTAVLQKCAHLLQQGGKYCIEDFVALRPLSLTEIDLLTQVVSASSVSSLSHYTNDLKEVHLPPTSITDMSQAWTAWCIKRHQDFIQNRAENEQLYGYEVYKNRAYFYETVANLFKAGNLGGIRIVGKKT